MLECCAQACFDDGYAGYEHCMEEADKQDLIIEMTSLTLARRLSPATWQDPTFSCQTGWIPVVSIAKLAGSLLPGIPAVSDRQTDRQT